MLKNETLKVKDTWKIKSFSHCWQQMIDEVETLKMEKQALESQLHHLQHEKDLEIQEYQQRLSALDLQIGQLLEVAALAEQREEVNQQLALELEKEKGKVEGQYLQEN